MRRRQPKWRLWTYCTIGAVFSLIATFALFRDGIIGTGTKLYLTRSLSPHLTIQQGVCNKELLTLSAIQFQKEGSHLVIDGATLSAPFGKLMTSPRQVFSLLKAQREGNWPEFLLRFHSLKLSPSIPSGMLTLEGVRYYFRLDKGMVEGELARLSLSLDPGLLDHPVMTIGATISGEEVILHLGFNQMPCQQLTSLCSQFFPKALAGYVGKEGRIDCAMSAVLGKSGLVRLKATLGLDQVEIGSQKSGLIAKVDRLRGEFGYPEEVDAGDLPVWKRIRGYLALENGDLNYGRLINLSKLSGTVSFDPKTNPTMAISGELAGAGDPLALKLEGRGAFHENRAYWLEFGLDLNDGRGIACSSFLSLCRPDADSLVMQVEADQLIPEQIAMLKGYFSRYFPRFEKWTVHQGTLGGRLIALFGKQGLSSIELQGVKGSSLSLEWISSKELFHLNSLEIEGRFTAFVGSPVGMLETKVEMPLCHLLHWPGKMFGSAYSTFCPDDPALLSMQLKFQEGGVVETLGSALFSQIDQSVQFGWSGNRAFPTSLEEVTEGWLRSQQLSHLFYGPLVRLASPGLEVYGDIDLLATYDGSLLTFSMQMEELLAKHPYFDLQVDKIGEKEKSAGRAKLTYNPQKESLEGSLPVSGGRAYDKVNGLLFEDLIGDVTFSLEPEKWRVGGSASEGRISLDGTPLLADVALNFSANREGITFSESMGQLPFTNERSLHLLIEKAQFTETDSRLVAHVIEGQNELASLTLKKKEHWEGSALLSTTPLSGEFLCALDWSRQDRKGALTASCAETSWHGKKGAPVDLSLRFVDGEVSIETLSIGAHQLKGSIAGHEIDFSLDGPLGTTKGKGVFSLEFPSEARKFAFLSEVTLKGEFAHPLSLPFETTEPFRIGFSPEMGCVLSQISLKSQESFWKCGHIEKIYSDGGVSVVGSKLSLSPEHFAHLIESGLLPQMANDIPFLKGFVTEFDLSSDGEICTAQGLIPGGVLWSPQRDPLHYTLELSKGNYTLFLSEEEEIEGLQVKGGHLENEWNLSSIRGALGPIQADLSSSKKGELRGSLGLDFQQLHSVVDLPFSSHLAAWDIGPGFKLQGLFQVQNRIPDWSFTGKLLGNGFTCKGHKVRSLEAKVQLREGHLLFEDLDVSDDAGKMWIGEGAIMKQGKEYLFHFPQVEIRGFQPMDLPTLTVKKGTIEQVRGTLNRVETLTGKGSLRFVNKPALQKGPLQNLLMRAKEASGLDTELFIPISGEVDFVIGDGRLVFSEIHSAFSVDQRSEFVLPKSRILPYIDFSGNCAIDVQLKQKGTPRAPLSISLRGKWRDPVLEVR